MPKKKLTPEEKKALKLQKRAERKKTAALKKIQRTYDYLQREIKYGSQTVKRLERSWRQMLNDIAVPRIREELLFAWHNFERTIDSKDFTISLMMDELQQAEEQYLRNTKSHMHNIDNLIILCFDQISSLRQESNETIQQLYTAGNVERSQIFAMTKENEEYLKTMIYMLQNEKKGTERFLRSGYASRKDSEMTRLKELMLRLRDDQTDMYNKLLDAVSKYLKDYSKSRKKKAEYDEMMKRDHDNQQASRHLWDIIYKQFDTIKYLRSETRESERTQSAKVNELLEERDYYQMGYRIIKSSVDAQIRLDKDNLHLLVLESNRSSEYLNKIMQKGENLLKLSAICSKFERRREKVLQFPGDYHEKNNFEIDDGIDPNLRLFWNRIAKADASTIKLAMLYENMKEENKQLKLEVFKCLNIKIN